MLEPGSNILEHTFEVLRETDAKERTYGTGDGGDRDAGDGSAEDGDAGSGDVCGGDAREDVCGDVLGGDVGDVKRTRVARTLPVERWPGSRGWRLMIGPTSSCLKVRGTSMPNFLCPNGELAENSK